MLGHRLPTENTGVVIHNGSTLDNLDRDNGHQLPFQQDNSADRVIAEGAILVPGYEDPEQKKKFTELQELEKELAIQYGMTGPVDSVEVRQEAQVRAGSEVYTDCHSHWMKMHNLYHLRINLAGTGQMDHTEPEVSPLVSKPMRTEIWAVLIGIDAYPSSPLYGCVSDAEKVASYLIEYAGVPGDHIQYLLGSSSQPYKVLGSTANPDIEPVNRDCLIPTRSNITDALLGLSTNSEIQIGASIIVYFSGHGSSYSLSEHPSRDDAARIGTTETLCPIDRGTLDNNGARVPDISDREINAILSEICRTKGYRITFILDCCHSAGITRSIGATVRCISPLPSVSIQDMFNAADKNLGHLPGYQSITRGDWRPNMDSHVVLAACKEYESAREVNWEGVYHGVFTRALISALKSIDLNNNSMSYYELLAALPKNDLQHPVIAGKWRDERLWFQE